IVADVGVERQALRFPQLAAAVEQADLDAIDVEHPRTPRGEPVVVVAIEYDLGIAGDAGVAQLGLELFTRGDVAPGRVDQFGVPVEVHRAGDVTALVDAGVDAHL